MRGAKKSNSCSLSEGKRIFHIDAEISDRPLDLRMPEKNLDGAQVSGRLVDN
jgi:hypothetical protein